MVSSGTHSDAHTKELIGMSVGGISPQEMRKTV